MRIRVSIFPGVKAGYRAFVSGWTRLALKFKRRVSAGDWDSPRPHSLFVFFSASSSGWSSVFGSMLLIDCVLRSLIVCCGRGWWLQKLLLSTDLLQVHRSEGLLICEAWLLLEERQSKADRISNRSNCPRAVKGSCQQPSPLLQNFPDHIV
uniref:Uncharacterized protein n=1 Tax=Physcomitrium patens TaxID=3218 RepID=A0A2K1J4R3_PHYPA|nr:hypothetical protein PHYPA_022367 [Physcomitrium patens]